MHLLHRVILNRRARSVLLAASTAFTCRCGTVEHRPREMSTAEWTRRAREGDCADCAAYLNMW